MTTDTDRESVADIVRRVQGGDVEAYALIVTSLSERVVREVARRVPGPQVREVTQEVFVRAYRALPSYSHRGMFEAWMARIARRTCQDFWRKRYRSRLRFEADLTEAQKACLHQAAAEPPDRPAEEGAWLDAAAGLLEKALGLLTPDDRAVITLLELEDRSVRETAMELGCSGPAAKVRAYRARKRLKRILERMMSEKEIGP